MYRSSAQWYEQEKKQSNANERTLLAKLWPARSVPWGPITRANALWSGESSGCFVIKLWEFPWASAVVAIIHADSAVYLSRNAGRGT